MTLTPFRNGSSRRKEAPILFKSEPRYLGCYELLKEPRLIRLFVALLLFTLTPGCGPRANDAPGTLKLAAANSYLECAAADVLATPVRFVRLAEPGSCPGHFDLRPSQVTDLQRCRALLRFDFQDSLDSRLAGSRTNRPWVVAVKINGGMGQAASYLSACEQVASALVNAHLLEQTVADERVRLIRERVNAQAMELRAQVANAGLTNRPVLASGHQKLFCEELGLRVVGAFSASDAARMSEVDQLIAGAEKTGVKLIVANLPEGRRLADALGERLGAKVIVFGNFPDPAQGKAAFDALQSANVRALLEAAR